MENKKYIVKLDFMGQHGMSAGYLTVNEYKDECNRTCYEIKSCKEKDEAHKFDSVDVAILYIMQYQNHTMCNPTIIEVA